jgi:hypothetical protein
MSIALDPIVPVWAVAIAAVALVVVSIVPPLLHARERLPAGRRAIVVLAGALGALLATAPLLRPSLERLRRERLDGVILVDASPSMATPDAEGGRSRLEAARLGARTLAHATGSVRWRTVSFADETRPGAATSSFGKTTLLGPALESAATSDPAVVVVFSDGALHDVRDPDAAARDLAVAGARTFAVALGRQDVAPPPSIASLDLIAPTHAVSGARAVVRARVAVEGLAGSPATVELTLDGAVVGRETLEVDSARAIREARFLVPLAHEGTRRLAASVACGARRATAERPIVVLPGRLRVLLVDVPARHEHRFLRRALDETPGIEVEEVQLRVSETQALPGGGASPAGPLAALARAQVVVLGEVPRGTLPADFATALSRAVERDGKGLLFLAGRGSSGLPRELGLGALLPLEPSEGASLVLHPYRAEATDDGLALFEDALALPATAARAAVERLPSLESFLPLGEARRGTTVLLEGPGRRPLLAVGRFGLGRTGALLTDETWRWAFSAPRSDGAGPREVHRALVTKLVERLAGRDALLRTPVELEVGESGDIVRATADAPEAAKVEVVLEDSRGAVRARATFPVHDGRAAIALERTGPPCDLVLRARALRADGTELGRDEAIAPAPPAPATDREGEPARPGVLEQVTARGGGATFAEVDLGNGRVAEAVASAAQAARPLARQSSPLAAGLPYALVVVAVLGLEWAVRRAAGLR